MKIRKIFLIGLVLLLGVAMFSMAAGGRAAQDGPGGVTTVRVWTNDAHNKVEVDAIVERFNATTGAQRGVFVEYTVYGADCQTAMNMALDTGREPEIHKAANRFIEHQAQGRYLPLSYLPGIEDLVRAQEPFHRNMSTVFGGEAYALNLFGWTNGFHYNRSLLQRAGFSAPPRTWAEFEAAAIAISQLEPGRIYGYAMPLAWPSYRDWLVDVFAGKSIGHPLYNSTQNRYMMAAFTPFFETLSRIREAGAMFPGMESLTDDQMRAQFAAGNIGFIGGGGWNVGVLYDQFPFQGDPLGWDYAPMPVLDANNYFAVPFAPGSPLYVSNQIRGNADMLEKVALVYRIYHDEDFQSIMYTNGKNIPMRADIVARAARPERPQWISYANTFPRTVTLPAFPHDLLAPEGATMIDVFAQILTGHVSIPNIRSTLEDLDRRYNASLQQAAQRGILNIQDFHDATLETRFRAR